MKIYVIKFLLGGEVISNDVLSRVDEGKIKVLLERIGYILDIILGQRKYGGLLFGWDGFVFGIGGSEVSKVIYVDFI